MAEKVSIILAPYGDSKRSDDALDYAVEHMLGDVAREVSERARCPVMLVHGKEAAG